VCIENKRAEIQQVESISDKECQREHERHQQMVRQQMVRQEELDLVMVSTHRYDRSILDTAVKTKVVFSTEPAKSQRKINGIRYGKTNNEGRYMVFLDVCGDRDVWAEEKYVDAKDIEDWQRTIAYDNVQRSKGVSTKNRTTRYRTKSVGDSSITVAVRYRPGPTTHKDQTNLSRIQHTLIEDNVVVISCRGRADTIVQDGQVTMEVLFVTQKDDIAGCSSKFEIQTIQLGYEPECFCGAQCEKRPCFHILAFFILKCKIDSLDALMWQVGLTEMEMLELAKVLRDTNALQPDACANKRIKSLVEQESMMISKGAVQRSITGLRRGEANGAMLLELKQSIASPKAKGRKRGGKALEAATPQPAKVTSPLCALASPSAHMLQSILDRGGPGARQAKLISPSHVSIESPESAMFALMAKARRPQPEAVTEPKRRRQQSTKVGVTKPPVGLGEIPAGQARIFKNWTVDRKCFGMRCIHKIKQGDWFVMMRMRSHYREGSVSSANQSYGFCLQSEGKCLREVETQLAKHMSKLDYHIVNCLPVYIHGVEQLKTWDDRMLDEIAAKLPDRQKPYLVKTQ
jgi:hypothetical protein